ncbi:MAG: hypothetical protein HFJ17_04055 [Clostridia bacterium]|nr:hypothetical protein [Clostridia bacterium]
MSKKLKKNTIRYVITLIITLIIVIAGYLGIDLEKYIKQEKADNVIQDTVSFDLNTIPEYKDTPYVILNNNKPNFTENDYTIESFEKYSELDKLGRCGPAFANISRDIMPKENEERGAIGLVKPSGWQTKKYNGKIDGNYLYNRCHLIGWQLAGENANERNLITGTRYMNVEGMLPFENQVDDYLEKKQNKNNHVLYRVTPIFKDSNLVVSGVQMEAFSVEDNGKGICFNVYVYNVQPGIIIDYKTGESKIE